MSDYHVIPVQDSIAHKPSSDCKCHPLQAEQNLFIHNAKDTREKYERQGISSHGWIVVEKDGESINYV